MSFTELEGYFSNTVVADIINNNLIPTYVGAKTSTASTAVTQSTNNVYIHNGKSLVGIKGTGSVAVSYTKDGNINIACTNTDYAVNTETFWDYGPDSGRYPFTFAFDPDGNDELAIDYSTYAYWKLDAQEVTYYHIGNGLIVNGEVSIKSDTDISGDFVVNGETTLNGQINLDSDIYIGADNLSFGNVDATGTISPNNLIITGLTILDDSEDDYTVLVTDPDDNSYVKGVEKGSLWGGIVTPASLVQLGAVKVASNNKYATTLKAQASNTNADYYGVYMSSTYFAYVNVPSASSSTLGTIKVSNDTKRATTLLAQTSNTNARYYGVYMSSTNYAYVNVPAYVRSVNATGDYNRPLLLANKTTANTDAIIEYTLFNNAAYCNPGRSYLYAKYTYTTDVKAANVSATTSIKKNGVEVATSTELSNAIANVTYSAGAYIAIDNNVISSYAPTYLSADWESLAYTYVNEQLIPDEGDSFEMAFSKLYKAILDNERVTAAALNDLNARLAYVEANVQWS